MALQKCTIKTSHSSRITCERSESAREWRIALHKKPSTTSITNIHWFFFFFQESILHQYVTGDVHCFTWVRLHQPQERCYPFLPVYAVFSMCPFVWLPAFGIFNMHANADACNCIWGLDKHHNRVCTESWLWENNPLPQGGIGSVSVLHLAFGSDTTK